MKMSFQDKLKMFKKYQTNQSEKKSEIENSLDDKNKLNLKQNDNDIKENKLEIEKKEEKNIKEIKEIKEEDKKEKEKKLQEKNEKELKLNDKKDRKKNFLKRAEVIIY